MSATFVNYNGNIEEAGQPLFNHTNRAFRYGDAVFETIRLMNGEILYFDKHLNRLKQAMKYLAMNWHPDFDFENLYLLIRHLDQVNQLKGNGRIRFEVFREGGGYYSPLSNNVSYIIEAESLADTEYKLNETGLKVDVFKEAAKPISALSNLKTSNSLCYILAAIHKQKTLLDDCILLNAEGNIAEAISSNIFAIIKGDVVTPAPDQGCVSGVMREIIIGMLKQKGKTVVETTLTMADLARADEVFLTNVIDGIRWVSAIREKRYFNSYTKTLLQDIKALQVNKV